MSVRLAGGGRGRRGGRAATSGGHRRRGGDDGSAAVEFVTVGVLLLVPLVYLVLALGAVQQGRMAAEAAASQAARSVARAPDADIRAGADALLSGYGVESSNARVEAGCRPAGCAPGDLALASVELEVALPLAPDPLSVTVRAEAVYQVARFRAAP